MFMSFSCTMLRDRLIPSIWCCDSHRYISYLTLTCIYRLLDGRRFLVKFPWIKWKITMDSHSDYKRGKVETWISPLFNAEFFRWRWKVNLVFCWPGERQDFLGIFSLDGRWSDTASVDQESQRDCKRSLTCTQQVVWRARLSFFLVEVLEFV